MLFDDNTIKVARKPGKKQKGNLVGCTRKVKDEKEMRKKCIEKIRREPPVIGFGEKNNTNQTYSCPRDLRLPIWAPLKPLFGPL